jgi:hypothetical protein
MIIGGDYLGKLIINSTVSFSTFSSWLGGFPTVVWFALFVHH